MKNAAVETKLKYIADKPTVNVTFIFDLESPEKSTYLIDLDKALQSSSKENWDEFNNKHKLIDKVESLKQILPTMMINLDKEIVLCPDNTVTFTKGE